jgi:hypothetical protein
VRASSEAETHSRGVGPSSEAGARPRDVRPSSETEVRTRAAGVSAWRAMGAVGP